MTTRPRYQLTLEPLPDVDAIRALRWILKSVLRRRGMRCISIKEVKDHPNSKGENLPTNKQYGPNEKSKIQHPKSKDDKK